MPYGYHINEEAGLVTITGSTHVPLMEAVSLGQSLLEDPEFDPSLPHLVDLRGLQLARTPDESAQFRDFVLYNYRPCVSSSVAIVVDDSLDRYSLAALFHLSCRMDHTELFDQYDQALKWLMRKEFAQSATGQITAAGLSRQ